jgi:CubicO group peptidase (beta-lactamase class C family)
VHARILRDPPTGWYPAEMLPTVRARLLDGIAQGLHLGGQIYVSRHGETIDDVALGDASPGVPLSREHLLAWASSSKPVAAIAIGQLWERGALALDDRVTRFLPSFGAGGKAEITLRHCLTHTGGFRMLDVGWPRDSWDEILERICASKIEPRWRPGERAGYHQQSSWFVLGEVVRRTDGRPFADYVRDEIFAPLGLDDCWVGMPVERFHDYGPRLAPMWNTETSPPSDHLWNVESRMTRSAPGSSGVGPAHQLGGLYEALLGGGERRGARIVRPQTVEALIARHRVGLIDQTFRKEMDWGLGFIPNPAVHGDPDVPYAYGAHASRRAVGHSGFRSSTAFADPEHELAVVLLLNGTPADAAHAARMRGLTEAIYEDLGLVPPPA